VPTSADAERLAHDLAIFVGEHRVDVFPAWETLPFERVSPASRRWAAGCARCGTSVKGASVRQAVHRRAGARIGAASRARCRRHRPHRRGPRRPTRFDSARSASGRYRDNRREYQVEHRGEFAVRGSIIDVSPRLPTRAVRTRISGATKVDRLSEFAIDDNVDDRNQRKSSSSRVASCYPTTKCELVPKS